MKLIDLFLKSAEAGLTKQKSNGAMPAGHNGPHNDPETPVRNTSHWLIIFLKAFELSGDSRFKKSAQSCLAYLLSEESRPNGATFFHRKSSNKDLSNGLIGQAWTIESLVYAFKIFKKTEILSVAADVFNKHPYTPSVQAWKIVEPNGTIVNHDRTFNHQLWFASIGCELIEAGISSVREPVLHFVQNLHRNIELYSDGIIKHYPYAYGFPQSLRKTVGSLKNRVKELINQKDNKYIHSVGYHTFNTYALSVIYSKYPDLPIFTSGLFKRSLEAINSPCFPSYLQQSNFAYQYNPPGIEIAVSLQADDHISDKQLKRVQSNWLNKQFEINYDFKKNTMSLNTPDPVTYHARLYELYRLNNFSIDIEIP